LRHYHAHTFVNNAGSQRCVTVSTTTACTGTQFIFVGAYLGSFIPGSICTNWIADAGLSPDPTQAFAFLVNAGATFVVVVSEVTPDAGCASYSITVTCDVEPESLQRSKRLKPQPGTYDVKKAGGR
jgi:hypothetical protein